MQPIVVADQSTLLGAGSLLVEIDSRFKSKHELLSHYATQLRFPDYFGFNWDAFDEVMRDLDWVAEHRIVIFHREMPLGGTQKDQRIYCDLLMSLAREWAGRKEHELVVAMDPSLRFQLNSLFGAR